MSQSWVCGNTKDRDVSWPMRCLSSLIMIDTWVNHIAGASGKHYRYGLNSYLSNLPSDVSFKTISLVWTLLSKPFCCFNPSTYPIDVTLRTEPVCRGFTRCCWKSSRCLSGFIGQCNYTIWHHPYRVSLIVSFRRIGRLNSINGWVVIVSVSLPATKIRRLLWCSWMRVCSLCQPWTYYKLTHFFAQPKSASPSHRLWTPADSYVGVLFFLFLRR